MKALSQLLFLFLILSIPLQAARAPDWAERARSEATDAMRKGQWEEALKVFQRVDQTMSHRDYLSTEWFGWFVYHRGVAELRLEKYQDAMKSFERYYRTSKSSHP